MNLLVISRWIHILAGLAWVGEVITINYVIVPALKSLPEENQANFISSVFPRVFRLATILALLSTLAGFLTAYFVVDWKDIPNLISTPWGIGIFGGAFLSVLLVLFHLVLERRIKPLVVDADQGSVERIIHLLGIIPRVGLGVILVISLLMFFGASAG